MIAATIGICETENAGGKGSRCRALVTTTRNFSIVDNQMFIICKEKERVLTIHNLIVLQTGIVSLPRNEMVWVQHTSTSTV